MSDEDALQHVGVLGMHWGHRSGGKGGSNKPRKSISREKIALGKQIALGTLAAGFAGVAIVSLAKSRKYKSIIYAMREPGVYKDVMNNIAKYA